MLIMNEFKETGAAFPLLRQYSGQRFKYKTPTEVENQAAAQLVVALTNYEGNESASNVNTIHTLLKTLGMTAHRVTSFNATSLMLHTDPKIEITEEDNILFFHANDERKGQGQLCFFWRFGSEIIPGNSATYRNTVRPFVVSSLHEGGDGAGFSGLAEFSRLKAKILVLNGLHAHASNLPSPFQPTRNISDGAHSPGTLTTPFLVQALRISFPQFALVVVHGLGYYDTNGNPRQMRLWFINSTAGTFDLKKKSWAALLTIAFAQKDFTFGEVSVDGKFNDYFIIDNKGKKRTITPKDLSYDNESLFNIIGGPTSDVQMHIVNNPVSLTASGNDSGRGVHIEHGYKYQFDGPELTKQQQHLLNAFDLASQWFIKWDPSVHNFNNMPTNFRAFPRWFDERLKLSHNEATPTVLSFTKKETVEEEEEEELKPTAKNKPSFGA